VLIIKTFYFLSSSHWRTLHKLTAEHRQTHQWTHLQLNLWCLMNGFIQLSTSWLHISLFLVADDADKGISLILAHNSSFCAPFGSQIFYFLCPHFGFGRVCLVKTLMFCLVVALHITAFNNSHSLFSMSISLFGARRTQTVSLVSPCVCLFLLAQWLQWSDWLRSVTWRDMIGPLSQCRKG